jgi:hypothetical protein
MKHVFLRILNEIWFHNVVNVKLLKGFFSFFETIMKFCASLLSIKVSKDLRF